MQARSDYAAIAGLLENPSENSRQVVARFVEQYANATVTIDGQSGTVDIPEVSQAQSWLSQYDSDSTGDVGAAGVEVGGEDLSAMLSQLQAQEEARDAEIARLAQGAAGCTGRYVSSCPAWGGYGTAHSHWYNGNTMDCLQEEDKTLTPYDLETTCWQLCNDTDNSLHSALGVAKRKAREKCSTHVDLVGLPL